MRTQNGGRIEDALPLMVEGSKAYSKGGRIGDALPLMVEGSKAHSTGGKIEDALPLMIEGSKAHLKRNEARARRRTQKEVG